MVGEKELRVFHQYDIFKKKADDFDIKRRHLKCKVIVTGKWCGVCGLMLAPQEELTCATCKET